MYPKKTVLPIVALTILLLASLACGASSNASPSLVATSVPAAATSDGGGSVGVSPTEKPAATVVPATKAPATSEKYKVGDIIAIGDHILTILGWENLKDSEYSKPDAGKKFVAVELLIVNNSQSAMNVSTILQMAMKDDTGQKYDVDFMASTAIEGGSVDGELAPGEKVRGKVGFQIAEGAKGLQFVFDASIFGTGKVFVDLGADPMKVEPPASLAGETTQKTYQLGDVIEIGTTTLMVSNVSYPAGDQYTKPDAGNKFLVLDVTIENKGASAITISTLMQMALKDSSGQKYNIDLMASTLSGGSSPDGEVAPGEKILGQVGFQVPETASGLIFVFDASVFGTGKVLVALP